MGSASHKIGGLTLLHLISNNAAFINVVAFGSQAEILNQYVTKGSRLGIEGKINTDSYINSKGEKKYGFVIILERFYFLDIKKEHIS